MRVTVHNMAGSPFDLSGGHRLEAGGTITADFPVEYVAMLEAAGVVRVERHAQASEAQTAPETAPEEQHAAPPAKRSRTRK